MASTILTRGMAAHVDQSRSLFAFARRLPIGPGSFATRLSRRSMPTAQPRDISCTSRHAMGCQRGGDLDHCTREICLGEVTAEVVLALLKGIPRPLNSTLPMEMLRSSPVRQCDLPM